MRVYRKASYLFHWVATALVCLFISPAWAVAEVVKFYNVDVYLTGAPQCQLIDIERQLQATVSPFQENILLGDIVTELARRAAQAGATVLHSIRVLSVTNLEGAQVAGVAAVCSEKSFGPFNAALVETLYKANSARKFFFPQVWFVRTYPFRGKSGESSRREDCW